MHKTETENPYVAAGRWLKNNYDENTRILSGVYSYVDIDHFETVEYTFEVTADTIRLFQPDIIFWSAISSHIHGEGEYVNIQYGYEIAKQYINPNTILLTGGLQATAVPKKIFK